MTLSASPASRSRARERWHVLADRLRTIRPEALAKGAIGIALIAVSVQLAVASWPALLPFAVGAVLAYAVLPIANRLDRFMPRVLAALLAELLAVALLVGVVVVVVPPLLNGIIAVAGKLPPPDQVRSWLASIQQDLGNLPEPARTVATSVLTTVTTDLRGVMQGFVDQAGAMVTSQILGIFDTLSNVLGLLVIPVWILTMVSDDRDIRRRGGRLFPEAVRPDVLALFRILDRVMATFLRVRMLLAVTSGFLIWAGLSIASELGLGTYNYAVAAAVLLGTLQLIPELGFFLGFFPLLLAFAIGGPVSGVTALVVYVAAVKIASALVETRLSRGVLDVHPALLIPAIVALSQFGIIWLVAAAPAVAIVRDLVRYANARLADPPGPAGVLPGEKVKRGRTRAVAIPTPSVYRATATAAPARPAAPRPPTQAAAPARTARSAPVPAVYIKLQLGARPPAVSQRSTQP